MPFDLTPNTVTAPCPGCGFPMAFERGELMGRIRPAVVCGYCGRVSARHRLAVTRIVRRRRRPRPWREPEAHFHRGPHGLPVPCSGSPCQIPRLEV